MGCCAVGWKCDNDGGLSRCVQASGNDAGRISMLGGAGIGLIAMSVLAWPF